MKKLLVLFCFLLIGLIQAQDPESPGKEIVHVYGDFNGDNIVDRTDVRLLKSYLNGKLKLPVRYREYWPNGDLNHDCKNTMADVTYLVKYIDGKVKIPKSKDCHKPTNSLRNR